MSGPLAWALAWLPLESEDAAVGSATLGRVEGRLRLSGTEDRAPLGACDAVGASVGSGLETLLG